MKRLGFVTAAMFVAAIGWVSGVRAQQTRDGAAPVVAGTAAVAGQVVTDEARPAPVRRAIVTVSGPDLANSRTAITDDDGRFVIRNLPAGRVMVSAIKSPYLQANYGAKRPGKAGTPLLLVSGQPATVSISMSRGGVITGVIRDRDGAPVNGIQVRAVDARAVAANGRADQTLATTDDRGVYRIFGLRPSDYLVVASVPRQPGSGEIGRRSDAETDALFAQIGQRHAAGVMPQASAPVLSPSSPANQPPPLPAPGAVTYSPVFFPGTPLFSSASRVTVAAGDERGGVDFSLTPVPVATIEGIVASGTGQALATIQMTITPDGPPTSLFSGPNPVLTKKPDADGGFRYTNVPPGRYTIVARSSPGAQPDTGFGRGTGAGGASIQPLRAAPGENLYAVAVVDVDGQPVGGLSLSLVRGSHLSGTLVFNGSTLKPPADLTKFQVQITPPNGTSMSSSNGTVMGNAFSSVYPVNVKADGTFELVNIAPGPYKMSITLPATLDKGWWLKSAMFDGKDLLDAPFEVTAANDLQNVVITCTDQHTELSGRLEGASGLPAPDYFVIAFPADRALWRAGSRRIVTTRPATDGAYSIKELPAGDYLLAAVTDVDPSDLGDGAFLEALAAASVKLTIADGEKKIQNVRLRAPGHPSVP